jgi:hypothetical protein
MNSNWLLKVLILALFFSFSGCKKKESKVDICSTSKDRIVFFSLKNYFCEKKNEFEAKGYKVNKRVSFGRDSEVIEYMEINWTNEFASLIAADINHTSWVDNFKTDTLPHSNGYSVNYQTEKRNIPVKQVKIEFNSNKEVQKIEIKTSRRNWMYNSGQSISFEPNVRYSIEGWQRALLLSKTEFKVEGIILSDNKSE